MRRSPISRRTARRARGLGALLPLLAALGLLSAAGAAAACPNEPLRVGPSAALPECRAYEMVSPPEKGGSAVLGYGRVQIGPGAGSALFLSTSALPGAAARPFKVADLATRAEGVGWSTATIDPPTYTPNTLFEDATLAVSEDLGTSLQVSRVALAPGAVEGGSNVYPRDNSTGALTTIAAEAGESLSNSFGTFGGPYFGGSPDWSRLVVSSTAPLSTDVPAKSSSPHLYDFTGGQFVLVDRLPNGKPSVGGAYTYADEPGGARRRGVSADASRVYFSVGAEFEAPLYLREDDSTTIPVSVSQRTGAGKAATPVSFGGASDDGSVAYFTSSEDLTDTSHNQGYASLYRFEVATRELSELTPSAESASRGAGVERVLAVSEDGSYVYFTATGALTPGSKVAEGDNVYVWHDGTLRLIGQTRAGDPVTQAEASPDGAHFAFVASTPLTPTDVKTAACAEGPVPNRCGEVFAYDYATGALSCASCDGPSVANSSLGSLDEVYVGLNREVGHPVLEDGSVILDTQNALVSGDSNGIGDVYLWRAGVAQLISTGTSDQPSSFAEATPDGSDIFFRTDQPLVGVDQDTLGDLYDARIGGGLAGQNPPAAAPPCEGEACRGSSAPLKALPPSAVAPPPLSSCDLIERRARYFGQKAKASAKKARASHGRAAKRRRRVAGTLHRKAKRARAEATTCRTAGR